MDFKNRAGPAGGPGGGPNRTHFNKLFDFEINYLEDTKSLIKPFTRFVKKTLGQGI